MPTFLELGVVSALVEEKRLELKNGKMAVTEQLLYTSVSSDEEEQGDREVGPDGADRVMETGVLSVDVCCDHKPASRTRRPPLSQLPAELSAEKRTTKTASNAPPTAPPTSCVNGPSGGDGKGCGKGEASVLSVELVTRLARATAARVLVHMLSVNTDTLDSLLHQHSSTRARQSRRGRKGVAISGSTTCIE